MDTFHSWQKWSGYILFEVLSKFFYSIVLQDKSIEKNKLVLKFLMSKCHSLIVYSLLMLDVTKCSILISQKDKEFEVSADRKGKMKLIFLEMLSCQISQHYTR